MVHRIVILIGLLGVLGIAVPCAADPFSLTGNLSYRENGGDKVDTVSSFSQSYNLGFHKQLSSMMNFTSSVRYNDSKTSGGNDSSSVNPSATFNLRNDFFFLSLNGAQSRTENAGSIPLTNKTWGANFYSQIEDWPGLRLTYNQSSTQDEQSEHEQDTKSSSFGMSLDYALAGFDLLYDLRKSKSEDLVADTTSNTLNNYAQLKYGNNFFHNRVSLSFSQQYSSSQTKTSSPAASDGTFVQPITILTGSAFSGVDATPLLGSLPANPQLIDGNRGTSAGLEIGQNLIDYQSLGFQVNYQLVSRIQVYLNRLLTVSEQGLWQWQLYRSSNNTTWTLVNQPLAVSFTTVSGRTMVTLDIPIQVETDYLKVRISPASSATLFAVYVTEVEAGELRTTEASRILSKSKFISHQTQLSVTYRPAPAWSTGYSLRRILNLPDSGMDSTQTSHSVNVSYAPNRYLSLALGANDTSNQYKGADTTRTRSYSLAFNSSPMDVLDFSLGHTRTYNYRGGEKTGQGDVINGNLTAELFPDLSLGFFPSWSRHRSFDSGSKTTAYGYSLTSTARLSPRLTLTASWDYNSTKTTTAEDSAESGKSTSKQFGATLSYRPSDVLLLNMGEQDTQRYSGSITWSICPSLTLQGTGGYQMADSGDIWNFTTNLNANF
ncbi:MAG: hypothetical protein P8X63_08135 [Desulfuromonadaceae bacterium]